MKIILTLYISFLFFLLSSCSVNKYLDTQSPEIMITESLDSTNIAILPFSKYGPFLSTLTGTLVADKLSDKLFLTKKFFTVERTKINDVLSTLEIKNPKKINYSEIQKIGTQLNAKFIITGNILQYSDTELIGLDSEYKININFRILSADSGEIVGVVNVVCSYKNTNTIDVIDSLVNEIVKGLLKYDN